MTDSEGLVTVPMGPHRQGGMKPDWFQVMPPYEVLPERICIAVAENGAEDNTLMYRPQEAKCKDIRLPCD